MKKFAALLMGALLAFACAAFAACGYDDGEEKNASVGALEGNFKKEATKDEIAELENLQFEVPAEDQTPSEEENPPKEAEPETPKEPEQVQTEKLAYTSEKIKLGLQLLADFTAGYAYEEADKSVDFDTDYMLALVKRDSGKYALRGAGEVSLGLNNDPEMTITKRTYNVYNDSKNVYLEDLDSGAKVRGDISQALKYAGEKTSAYGVKIPTEIPETFESPNVPSMPSSSREVIAALGDLIESGVKVYLDLSDGLKIKISFTPAAFIDYVAALASVLPGVGALVENVRKAIDFEEWKFDGYIGIGGDGLFSHIGADFDFRLKLNPAAIAGADESSAVRFKAKGGCAAKLVAKGTILHPADPESYSLINFG